MWRYDSSPTRPPAAPSSFATTSKKSYTTMYDHHPPPPPFRVLSPGGRVLYEPQAVLRSPPPTRVPEPYKVAPQAASYGRNQRKSSFAIIAETRPPSPQGFVASSRPGSPQLASGRVSPFRGRGFKGPPPRSHSRPHSPDEEDEGGKRAAGRRSRYDPRVSTSQQSSPRRSQIPRPAAARSRSTSASKEPVDQATRKASPKFGRRAANRYTSSVINNNNNNHNNSNNVANNRRSSPLKEPRTKLSPIQGTPTKPATEKAKGIPPKPAPRGFGTHRAGRSPDKLNRNLLLPPKNVPGGKRFVTANNKTTPAAAREKFASAESLSNGSPSKIPLRKGSLTGSNSTSTPALNKTTASGVGRDKAASQSQINSRMENGNSGDSSKASSDKKPSSSTNGIQLTGDEDLALVDLLKQSSGAMGTSSVVNTTTTTAVQPLQIDASSILAESELVAKLTTLEKKQKMEERSPDSQVSSNSRKNMDNEAKAGSSSNPSNQQMGTEDRDKDIGGGKNGNLTQTMIKHFGPNSTTDDSKGGSSGNSGAAMDQNKSGNTASNVVAPAPAVQSMTMQNEQDKKQEQSAANSSNGHKKTDSKTSIARSSTKSNNSNNDSKKMTPSTRGNSATDMAAESKNKNNANESKRNNETTLKTQAQAVSSESLGSLRSTDTGVSVNTVRGVSSAKEKTGLHMVKRSEEIETLSGNIVHLDTNGDHPQGVDVESGTTPVGPQNRWQRIKAACWKRLGRDGRGRKKKKARGKADDDREEDKEGRKCWPRMRCLACRRDPKVQLWPGRKQARGASTVQLTASPGHKAPGKWDRFKDACRCSKVRWCGWRRSRRRQQQIQQQLQQQQQQQPAVQRQQPPQRLGGLCQRLFSHCSCGSWPCRRRPSDQSQRGRTVKAKHSLTSVAAPPLSEETRPKIPDVLVEHNSVMRGAIPCLPVPVAWFCLIWNVLVPGSGTIFSGLFNICLGQPRFSAVASPKARFGALIVNIIVGVSQLFTVLFCLVGWGWSIWWGVSMVRLARKYKRFKDSEAASSDPEGRAGPETATLPAPGVQALRGGVERSR